jgi:hypothetical protein
MKRRTAKATKQKLRERSVGKNSVADTIAQFLTVRRYQ